MDTNYERRLIKVEAPKRHEILTIRVLICCAIAVLLIFIAWFIQPEHQGYAPVYWLLTSALIFKIVKMVHEWYHYWSPSVPVRPALKQGMTVDMLTTSCPGEPREMIIRTLEAMVAVTYPHTNYLCDEGDDPVLREFCRKHGIVHVTRKEKVNAKAGNINNALKQATGEICVVLDPDHVPVPEFLDRVLPYFEDEKIGFVQCVQAYGNQSESFIARGAAEQTYHFYGPMMMCMNTYGTVQAIGANCTFRRAALDSIGGHAAGLSEDMHTAMQLHAKGWKSVYVPEVLTRGLVPASLSAYYKQQLKWSRGTFDLLFHTFPKLYRNFTWRQKLHYFTIPLYFLFGLINLVDITVPLLALSLAETPWQVHLPTFASSFIPLCVLSLIIRLYAQRWLLEPHERGFHFAGGVVRLATWWIFLVGFIYTIFNIKVPYIPTPKEDERQNYFRLSLPNIFVILISIALVGYGLMKDYTPYSLAMASYSGLTAGLLGLTVILSQQKLLDAITHSVNRLPAFSAIGSWIRSAFTKTQQVVYLTLRNGVVLVITSCSLVFISYSELPDAANDTLHTNKELGGFYFGQYGTAADGGYNLVAEELQIVDRFPVPAALDNARGLQSVPYLQWVTNGSSENLNALFSAIVKGEHDSELEVCAEKFRAHKGAVFISFMAPTAQKELAPAFVLAWQHIYTFFNDLGISNLTWVWVPGSNEQSQFYPGEKFTDWIGTRALNYASGPAKKDWYTFKALYTPFRAAFGRHMKPVLIAGLGCQKGEFQSSWFKDAFTAMSDFKEIKGVVLETRTQQLQTAGGLYTADFALNERKAIAGVIESKETLKINAQPAFTIRPTAYKSKFISGSSGNFELRVNGKPFYIRGVAYNTAHDWRDGNMPLTRKQVETDLQAIREMGANTIRRYGTGIYDRNVLNIAAEFDMKVLYGFWFDPKIDYVTDDSKLEEYFESVEEMVTRYKDHPSVLGWSLGNESWGQLKHYFAKPYLVSVRNAYIAMIERLAQRIHEIDPTRPVFSCIEHEEYQLAGEIVAFRDGAPSVDVIGINSYYNEQISKLNHVAWQFDSLRPYIVSEFGPRGYWDPKYNRTQDGSLIEENESEKAEWYRSQWKQFVLGFRGYNVGGFAYCWHDRMEGSYTWFGLSDFKGRLKPAYYALKEEWTGVKEAPLPVFTLKRNGNIEPGKVISFTAYPNDRTGSTQFRYEWRLLEKEYLDEVDNIETTDDPRTAQVELPEEPGNYRLYLHAVAPDGERVTTASVPIRISQKK